MAKHWSAGCGITEWLFPPSPALWVLIFQIPVPWFLLQLGHRPLPSLSASYLHYHIGPWLRAILRGRKVGGPMESDWDDLLIRGRQVADDRVHILGGIRGLLWALGDLWGKPRLSAASSVLTSLYCLPITLAPSRFPSEWLFSSVSPTASLELQGQSPLSPFSPYLCPTLYVSVSLLLPPVLDLSLPAE